MNEQLDMLSDEHERLVVAARAMLATLIAVRDSFIYVDDHSDTAVLPEADSHRFDDMCAAIAQAEAAGIKSEE